MTKLAPEGQPLVQTIVMQKGSRYFVYGDIHGAFWKVRKHLAENNYDAEKDFIIFVGDLVDRGDTSEEALDWLRRENVFAVMGNHEQFPILLYKDFMENKRKSIFDSPITEWWIRNGGAWFFRADGGHDLKEWHDELIKLPYIIFLESENGRAAVIHAELPLAYDNFTDFIENHTEEQLQSLLWQRKRINMSTEHNTIKDVDYVICGHTIGSNIRQLGNTFYIDTGAYHSSGKLACLILSNEEEVV